MAFRQKVSPQNVNKICTEFGWSQPPLFSLDDLGWIQQGQEPVQVLSNRRSPSDEQADASVATASTPQSQRPAEEGPYDQQLYVYTNAGDEFVAGDASPQIDQTQISPNGAPFYDAPAFLTPLDEINCCSMLAPVAIPTVPEVCVPADPVVTHSNGQGLMGVVARSPTGGLAGAAIVSVQQLDPRDLKAKLKAQLEYYFSRENLSSDTYLRSKMDADLYVPIDVIAGFNKVKNLTADINLIVDVLKESQNVQVDEKKKRVRPVHKRCTLVLRETADETTKEEIEALFSGASCPPIASVENATNNSWYVTFESDKDAQRAFRYLREERQTFQGKPIMVRIKPRPMPRLPLDLPPPTSSDPVSIPLDASPAIEGTTPFMTPTSDAPIHNMAPSASPPESCVTPVPDTVKNSKLNGAATPYVPNGYYTTPTPTSADPSLQVSHNTTPCYLYCASSHAAAMIPPNTVNSITGFPSTAISNGSPSWSQVQTTFDLGSVLQSCGYEWNGTAYIPQPLTPPLSGLGFFNGTEPPRNTKKLRRYMNGPVGRVPAQAQQSDVSSSSGSFDSAQKQEPGTSAQRNLSNDRAFRFANRFPGSAERGGYRGRGGPDGFHFGGYRGRGRGRFHGPGGRGGAHPDGSNFRPPSDAFPRRGRGRGRPGPHYVHEVSWYRDDVDDAAAQRHESFDFDTSLFPPLPGADGAEVFDTSTKNTGKWAHGKHAPPDQSAFDADLSSACADTSSSTRGSRKNMSTNQTSDQTVAPASEGKVRTASLSVATQTSTETQDSTPVVDTVPPSKSEPETSPVPPDPGHAPRQAASPSSTAGESDSSAGKRLSYAEMAQRAREKRANAANSDSSSRKRESQSSGDAAPTATTGTQKSKARVPASSAVEAAKARPPPPAPPREIPRPDSPQ